MNKNLAGGGGHVVSVPNFGLGRGRWERGCSAQTPGGGRAGGDAPPPFLVFGVGGFSPFWGTRSCHCAQLEGAGVAAWWGAPGTGFRSHSMGGAPAWSAVVKPGGVWGSFEWSFGRWRSCGSRCLKGGGRGTRVAGPRRRGLREEGRLGSRAAGGAGTLSPPEVFFLGEKGSFGGCSVLLLPGGGGPGPPRGPAEPGRLRRGGLAGSPAPATAGFHGSRSSSGLIFKIQTERKPRATELRALAPELGCAFRGEGRAWAAPRPPLGRTRPPALGRATEGLCSSVLFPLWWNQSFVLFSFLRDY